MSIIFIKNRNNVLLLGAAVNEAELSYVARAVARVVPNRRGLQLVA